MAIGIDPTVDFACKRVLGSPDHPNITLHFLNSVLRFPSPIRHVQILNPAVEKEFEDDKWSLLDILATDEQGRLFDIEVQTTRPLGLRQRLTYYIASLLVGQLERGGDYHELRPSIGICLLDAIEFPDQISLHHQFQMRTDRGLVLTDCLQVHLFELPKYVVPDDNVKITDPIEQWLYFFRRAGESAPDELVCRLPDPVFAEATGVLEMIARNPNERRLYNERLKMERDERARILQARQEGLQEGRREGESIGEMRGKVKVLRDLLQELVPTDLEILDFSVDDLAELEATYQLRLRQRG